MAELLKRIIPCLDVDRGRVVKGVHFQNLRDMGDPVELAAKYEQDGADEVVFLDISATVEARPNALEMVRKVSQTLSIPFTLGGGLRTLKDIDDFLAAGSDKVCFNSAAIQNPDIIQQASQQFGSQCIVVAMDVSWLDGLPRIFSHGGRKATDFKAFDWAQKMADLGAGELLVTSIDRDGTGSGYDLELTQAICEKVPVPVIASGGAREPKDLKEAFEIGASAALAATMFHASAYPIPVTKQLLREQGVPVRWEATC